MVPSVIEENLHRIEEIAPAGYHAAFRITMGRPSFSRFRYPDAWREEIRARNLAIVDPTIVWAMTHQGSIRWSEMRVPDPFDVLGRCRRHGLEHGLTIAMGRPFARSMIGMARPDREFTDAEIAEAFGHVRRIHDALARGRLAENHLRALEYLQHGYDRRQICRRMNFSQGELRACLAGARKRLGVATVEEAVTAASETGLIGAGSGFSRIL